MITGGSEAAVTPHGPQRLRRHAGPLRAERRSGRAPAGRSTAIATASSSAKAPGMLVLEELEHAKARGAQIYAEMLGYGASCRRRPHHRSPTRTASAPPTPWRWRSSDAGVDPGDDRLHQRPRHEHAAGRPGRNDGHQERSSGEHARKVSISSTKSQLGHLLGASGGVELMLVDPGPARRRDSADDQLRHARPGVRSGLHAQPGPRAEDLAWPCRTASASAATTARWSSEC